MNKCKPHKVISPLYMLTGKIIQVKWYVVTDTHSNIYWQFHFSDLFAALKPGEVQNLRSTLNTNEASLTLNWDQPNNVITAGDVTAYDIRFIISGNGGGNNYYSIMTVNAPARSIHLTRESGLKPLTKYSFEVRARNFHCQGEWSCISTYIGMCMCSLNVLISI